jgi:hypothetical protein
MKTNLIIRENFVSSFNLTLSFLLQTKKSIYLTIDSYEQINLQCTKKYVYISDQEYRFFMTRVLDDDIQMNHNYNPVDDRLFHRLYNYNPN